MSSDFKEKLFFSKYCPFQVWTSKSFNQDTSKTRSTSNLVDNLDWTMSRLSGENLKKNVFSFSKE